MKDCNTVHTEAATVAEIVQDGLPPVEVTVGASQTSVLAFGPNTRLTSLERFQSGPVRARGTQVLTTLKDLQQFLEKQANDGVVNTVIFANRDALLFTAILDYHHKDIPRWMDHRATVQYKESRQLTKWKALDGQKLTQEQFATFLEENIADIVDPVGADVLTFAETLEATRTETFKSSITTSTGEMNLAYSSERNGEQSSKLITDIKLGIPLFHGGEPYEVKVKIFHRVTEGRLSFWFNLRHLDHLIDAAWAADMDFLLEAVKSYATVYQGVAPAESSAMPLA